MVKRTKGKRALTTGEIADYCGVNFRTVIRWIGRGELKAYQLPGRGDNRVLHSDFLAFLKKNDMPIPADFLDNARRVLIVEDDGKMAKTIARVLNRAGFETQIAADGFQAGTMLRSFVPAVITLDLRMPGLGGLAVVQAVRSDSEVASTRILVVSAMPEEELEQAIAAGADEALSKPFKNKELVTRVAALAGVELD